MASTKDPTVVLVGRVVTNSEQERAGFRVEAWDKDIFFHDFLAETVTDDRGTFLMNIDPEGFRELFLDRKPDLFFRVYAGEKLVCSTEHSVLWNVKSGRTEVIIDVSSTASGDDPTSITFRIVGRVVSQNSTAVGGLRVAIVDKAVGPDLELARTVTNSAGEYAASFNSDCFRQRRKAWPDLQARVFHNGRFLGASSIHYNASTEEILDVRLDDELVTALPSEHQTIISTLRVHYQGSLGALQESSERRDITYLAHKSGWDARAVAMVALADQFSARTGEVGTAEHIPPALFYALFRAGVPGNEAALYQTESSTVFQAWTDAVSRGVVDRALEQELPAALDRFEQAAARRMFDGSALVGFSSFKEMLGLSLGHDSRRHEQVVELYTRHGSDLPTFWASVGSALGEGVERRLRLDGQLAYLTLNNAPLIRRLHAERGGEGLSTSVDLVRGGYYRPEKWRQILAADPIPPSVPGETDGERRSRYAEVLAAQIRLGFPTAVLADQVLRGEVPLEKGAAPGEVHAFLMKHQGEFDVGSQPVERFIARARVEVAPEVRSAVTRIQRVYQITPNDDAMAALLRKGVDSAYAVVSYRPEEFVRLFKDDVGGESVALQIRAKAQQVHNAVLNVAVSYLAAANAPAIGAHSEARFLAPAPIGPNASASDVIAYPTLEELQGELDFCECQHCRSVLSPAAYLVDLLHFLDPKDDSWSAFVADWRREHAGAPYPFATLTEWNDYVHRWREHHEGDPPSTEIKPLNVLLSRRPDLQYLPLTCENTNTPVPYVDLVNEMLEYYVLHGSSLSGYEGHSTDGSVASQELLADPQFALPAAYDYLAGQAHEGRAPILPPTDPFPFDQPLQALRRYFDRFDAPLSDVRAALVQESTSEAWEPVLLEELRLSPGERASLTTEAPTLREVFGYPPETTEEQVRANLSRAKAFATRVKITYAELVEILRTRFINPASVILPRFERLRVTFAAVKALRDALPGSVEERAFDDLVREVDQADYDPDIKGWVRAHLDEIMGMIALTDPEAPEDHCSFEDLLFRYADPDRLDQSLTDLEFLRLHRFIRIWRKLGWTISQTDKALTALAPPSLHAPASSRDFASAVAATLVRLGALKRLMRLMPLNAERDLLPLLACFADIDSHGASSLYRSLFPAHVRKEVRVFNDNGLGEYLTDESVRLLAHSETLRGAFQLTSDELGEIAEALFHEAEAIPPATPLTLPNVSAIFRRGWLARKLKLSVRELLGLARATGINPFAPLDPPALPLLRFLDAITLLRSPSLKPAQALYLVWNDDVSGSSAPSDADIWALARTLRASLAAVESELALSEDPDGRIARARLALVYGTEVTDLFFGLLENTFVVEIPYDHNEEMLSSEIRSAADDRLKYDDFRKLLGYSGLLTTETATALTEVEPDNSDFRNAVDDLLEKCQAVVAPFFLRYPELRRAFDDYVASRQPEAQRRADLLASILPGLKAHRRKQQALQVVASASNDRSGFAQWILDGSVDGELVLHAAADVARPAVEDLSALEMPGLEARFFFGELGDMSAPDLVRNEPTLDYRQDGPCTLPTSPSGTPVSGVWSGYLEPPETGHYNLRIEVDADAIVTLTLGEQDVPLASDSDGVISNSAPLQLLAGVLLSVTLRVERVKHRLSVRWRTESRSPEVIPRGFLYSASQVEDLRRVHTRFLKTVSLATALRLSPREIATLSVTERYKIGGRSWLNGLPVDGRAEHPLSESLWRAFQALLEFSHLKTTLAPTDDLLLEAQRASGEMATAGEGRLFALTRWDSDSVDALLVKFGYVVGGVADRRALADIAVLAQVARAYQWLRKLGISGSALIAATAQPADRVSVAALQSALRARLAHAEWLKVLKDVNDEMRGLQRDVLVGYVLHQMGLDAESQHIDTPEKLFEYFLTDVQMQCCMQTSRIRHALSSVQLFIDRCLMSLEPRVSPVAINSKQWQWMNRYRIWEANRKVFLYPENWLEPELRLDATPVFKEALGELLQGDITDERATTAFLTYLSKLDEVAKLEPCGIHYVEPSWRSGEVVHVVARTAGANRKYFYRRREDEAWTPWEHIKLDIEDNPVVPFVWKNRLFLFWLRILKKPAPLPSKLPHRLEVDGTITYPKAIKLADIEAADVFPTAPPEIDLSAVLCWSECFNGKWQPTRTSDVNNPLFVGRRPMESFNRASIGLDLAEESDSDNRTSRLSIRLVGFPPANPTFTLYNSTGLPEQSSNPDGAQALRRLDTTDDLLKVTFNQRGLVPPHDVLRNLTNPEHDRTVQPRHARLPHGVAWNAPFFYEDARHVFYVTPHSHEARVPEWDGYVVVPPSRRDLAPPPPFRIPGVFERALPLEAQSRPGGPPEQASPPSVPRLTAELRNITWVMANAKSFLYGDRDVHVAGSSARLPDLDKER